MENGKRKINIDIKNKIIYQWLLIIFIFVIVTLFSLYSVSDAQWIWEKGNTWQKLLGTSSALVTFTGILAIFSFFHRLKKGYFFAILNAFFYGIFALSVNLMGDFIVNILLFCPILFFQGYKDWKNDLLKNRCLNKFWSINFIVLFAVLFLFFYFLTPPLNLFWGNIINQNATYGANFNFYGSGRILDTIFNCISVVGLLFMIMGYWQTWIIWIIKDIVGILLFSGLAFINISLVIMNVVFLIMSSYILWLSLKQKTLKVAIIGPGAAGKTTIINHLKPFLEKNNFTLIDERNEVKNNQFSKYMDDLKANAYEMQLFFFEQRIKQAWKLHSLSRGLMDRHSIDDWLFSHVHIKEKNFSEPEIKKWFKKEKKYLRILSSMPKLDIVFLIMADNEVIEKRRQKRSQDDKYRETETKNKNFFQVVNAEYNNQDSILYTNLKRFAKKHEIFKNNNSKETAKKIEDILSSKLSE